MDDPHARSDGSLALPMCVQSAAAMDLGELRDFETVAGFV